MRAGWRLGGHMRKVTGMLVVALCWVLVGCGSSAEEERAAAEASASAQAADEKAAELEAARAAQAQCEDQLGDSWVRCTTSTGTWMRTPSLPTSRPD